MDKCRMPWTGLCVVGALPTCLLVWNAEKYRYGPWIKILDAVDRVVRGWGTAYFLVVRGWSTAYFLVV
ncbi:6811_t:CDS:2 [Entrophospora sp. SA101]|nr:6811_t:CDS:2 [Entrophospora sp. SA101]